MMFIDLGKAYDSLEECPLEVFGGKSCADGLYQGDKGHICQSLNLGQNSGRRHSKYFPVEMGYIKDQFLALSDLRR